MICHTQILKFSIFMDTKKNKTQILLHNLSYQFMATIKELKCFIPHLIESKHNFEK